MSGPVSGNEGAGPPVDSQIAALAVGLKLHGEDVLIGRDSLLQRDIFPRVKDIQPFILAGQRGVGKSTVLHWAFVHAKGRKLYFSGRQSYGVFVRQCVEVQGGHTAKVKVDVLERDIFQGPSVTVFIDDFEKVTSKLLGLLTALCEIWPLYIAGNGPYKEEAKRVLWGRPKIIIPPLEKKYRRRLAEVCVQRAGRGGSIAQVANCCRGIPARAWALARGEVFQNDEERVSGEEVNYLPVMLVLVAGVMITRYIGKGLGEQDIVMMGGLGMGAGLMARFLIGKGSGK